ncbi:MAG: hypothetical protein HPY45_00105 [Anaerolineae bacterium]|nr:hypothetical protein [Anaerolineae bacterium]
MNRVTRFIAGAMLGGVVAALIVLLLAPSSGRELRGQIAERFVSLKEEIRQAALQRRAELEEELARLRASLPS